MEYNTKGTCSRQIKFDVVDNKVTGVQFVMGCHGNTDKTSSKIKISGSTTVAIEKPSLAFIPDE